jgi:hypothetical protein
MSITDYDAPRRSAVDVDEDSLDELKAQRAAQTSSTDLDETEFEVFELPGGDLSDEELTVAVVPQRSDEFRCGRCFLVHHRSQLAMTRDGQQICRDCA